MEFRAATALALVTFSESQLRNQQGSTRKHEKKEGMGLQRIFQCSKGDS